MELYILTPLISSTPISPLVSTHLSLCPSISTASLYPISACQTVWNSRHSGETSPVRRGNAILGAKSILWEHSDSDAHIYTCAHKQTHTHTHTHTQTHTHTHTQVHYNLRMLSKIWLTSNFIWRLNRKGNIYTRTFMLKREVKLKSYYASETNVLSSFPLVYMTHTLAQVSKGEFLKYTFQREAN